MTIDKDSSGSASAIAFSLYNDTTGAAITGHTWNDVGAGVTDELKFSCPATRAWTNVLIANIVEWGLGQYQYQPTATDTADPGAVGVRAKTSLSSLEVQWDRVVAPAASLGAGAITRATFAQDALDLFREARYGTAQAGSGTTITLDASASATNDIYTNGTIRIVGGTGIGQTRQITLYVGATKIATVDSAWFVNPDNTSIFEIFGEAQGGTPADIAAAVLGASAEGSITLVQMIRLLVSLNGCKVTDFTTGSLVFRNVADTKTRWTVTTDDTGRLTITPGDLT